MIEQTKQLHEEINRLELELNKPRMNSKEACRYLGIDIRTLRTLIARPTQIPFVKVTSRCNIFERKDLDAFLEKRRVTRA